jgi:hypothetical protein
MLADLISASNGSLLDDVDQGLTAHFGQPADAYRAAKRVQWALLEFCQQKPNQCLGAGVVLYDAADSGGHAESNLRQVAALLEGCRPAQVLATARTGGHLQDMPGLQFRALSSTSRSRSDWQGGAQEVLWTTTSNLKQIQEKLKEIAQNLILQQEAQRQSPPPVQQQVPASEQATIDFSNAGGYRAAPTMVLNEPIPSVDPLPPVESVESPSLAELVEDDPYAERSGARYLWWSLAAVMVVMAVVILVLGPKFRTKTDTEAPASAPVSQQQVTQQVQPTPTPEPPVATQPSDTVPPSSPPPGEPPKPPVHRPAAESPAHAQPKKVAEYRGMSEKDIPVLLRMAEKDAGAGNYDDARQKFDIVLHLDPGNAEAKQGMKKLDLSEREAR